MAYTKPHHEKKIILDLKQTGIENFLPCTKKLRVWSDRRKYINAPLFPSYVFVKLDDNFSYFRSLDINGVLYYVRNGKELARIEESIILDIMNIVSKTSGEITVSAENISPGEKLVICDGPFTGLSCEMIRHNGKQKVLVRIDLICRNIIADMPVQHVTPASQILSVIA